jgi:hypothetical protein
MTITRAFTIVIASGFGFGAVGGIIGFCIGCLTPDFYRVLFGRRIEEGVPVDFAAVGLALGLTQGLMTGVGVGLVIVLAVSWLAGRKLSAGAVAAETKNESW